MESLRCEIERFGGRSASSVRHCRAKLAQVNVLPSDPRRGAICREFGVAPKELSAEWKEDDT